jgi:hypothetical protein
MAQSASDLSTYQKLMTHFVETKPSIADIDFLVRQNKKEHDELLRDARSGTRTRGTRGRSHRQRGSIGTPYESAIAGLVEIFQMSYALASLPSNLSEIATLSEKLIDNAEGNDVVDKLRDFNRAVKKLNERMEKDLDEWIKVEGIFKNSLEDFFSKLGLARSGMSYRLLSLFCILQAAMETDSLYQGTLTLVAKNEANNKVIDL